MEQDKEKIKRKAKKVVDNNGSLPLAQLDATLELADKLEDMVETMTEHHAEMMEKPEVQKVELVSGEESNDMAVQFFSMLKGKKGDKGDKGDKGEQGEEGKDGIDGIDGKNGIDGIDGVDGKNGIDGIDGKDGKDGVDGKDGSPDTPEMIAEKLESLEGDARLDVSAIKGLDFPTKIEVENKIKENARSLGGSNIEVFSSTGKIGSGSALKFTGSGVSSVTSDGHTSTINISGGAGGGHTIQDEGTPLTQRTNLNFVGAGVTVTDGGAGPDSTIVTIAGGGGSGTVTDVSVVSANGFAGTVATSSTTPAITLSTTVTGMLKGNGTAISAASAGIDYVAPGVITSSGLTMSTARLLGRTTAATGAVEEISAGATLSLAAGTLGVVSSPILTIARTIGTITGDATSAGSSFDGSANNTNALTLATVNANVGSFGSATAAGTFTVNAKGLITAAGSTTITPAVGSITGLGTGVATALAVNVGSAGAFVTFNGALGTPSSGTVTNLTGTASININGTVGATTPTTGVFTTLVAGSTTSLLLGTAGSAVGNIGFRNATSGTITLAPVAGALGTVTLTLPATTDTVAVLAATQTFTNKTIQGAAITGALTGTGAYIPVTLLNSGTSASASTFWRGDGTWATPAGSGTVTATGGSLTANSVVLGAGGTDTKVVAGITTNGTAQLVLGVNTTTIGTVKMFGNTSGDVTITPTAVAGTATVWTLPATSDTFVGKATTDTLTNKTLTAAKIASGGFLADANGNELVVFTTTASAVNEITYANAATGGNPSITPSGGDTNISLKLAGKGTGAVFGNLETITVAISDETTAITTGTAKVTFRMPYAFNLLKVKASLTAASSSGTPTFDINEAGTTILSTKLTIDASELTSKTAATAAVISDSTLADDAEMTIDIDVAGTGAKGAKIYLIGYATAMPA